MSAAFAASMQLIPSCTSTSTPSMVIFAICDLGGSGEECRISAVDLAAGEDSRSGIRESFHKRGEYSRGWVASMMRFARCRLSVVVVVVGRLSVVCGIGRHVVDSREVNTRSGYDHRSRRRAPKLPIT